MDLAIISVRNVYLRPTVRIFTVYILHVTHADVYGVCYAPKNSNSSFHLCSSFVVTTRS